MYNLFNTRNSLLYMVGLIALCQCQPLTQKEQSPSTLLTKLSNSHTGISFNNTIEENIYSTDNVLTFDNFYNGGGVGISDLNNDGLADIILTGNQVNSAIYLNQGNLTFEDVTSSSQINTGNIWANGVTIADVNQDGWDDIYICAGGPSLNPAERQNQLWINNQDGTFSNKAKEMGVNDSRWSNHASFFDMDKDGDLDLFVMNHTTYWRVNIPEVDRIMQDSNIRSLASNQLYENLGNGTFKNITKQAGIERHGYGLGLITTDLNNDGLTDIYVANDYSVPDFMYINQGNNTFIDEIKNRTKQISYYGMGCDAADYNNDGHPDILVVDMAIKDHYRSKTLMASMNTDLFHYLTEFKQFPYQYMFNSFQLNNQNGSYTNIANSIGLSKTDWSWTALFADLDQDLNKDVIISNGIVRYPRDNDFRLEMEKVRKGNNGSIPDKEKERLYAMMPSIPLANKVFRNSGNLTLEDTGEGWGITDKTFSYGCAYADLDNDGDLDIVFNNTNTTASIYQNNSNRNYLTISGKGKNNLTYYNTKIDVFANNIQQTIEITPTRGYFSASESKAHFGLSNVSLVDSIIVTLPNNSKLIAKNIDVNQELNLADSQFTPYSPNQQNTDHALIAINPAQLNLNYQHYENPHNEYAKEMLLPHSQSSFGPFSAVADVNNDGFEDIFFGGGSNQSGVLYLQEPNGTFSIPENQPWVNHFKCEDQGAVFFDANNDGHPDLYVVSGGGSEFEMSHELLQDRLYLNNGNGDFTYSSKALPNITSSGMRVSTLDFDNDGDIDLFVGGRTSPSEYPKSPQSYLLENKNGKFTDVTKTIAPELQHYGMITDIECVDFDNNGFTDILVSAEWQHLGVFLSDGNLFTESSSKFGLDKDLGWFYSLTVADINQDGHLDLIAGNLGLNNKFNPTYDTPLHIFMNDFDANGSNDIVLSKKYKENLVPVRGRECSSQQMPFISQKFQSYASFANASINDIYGDDQLSMSIHFKANNFASLAFISVDARNYTKLHLPIEAQASCINDILIRDLNNDQNPEIILVGNQFNTEPETPRYDGSNGVVLEFRNGQFYHIPNTKSGLFTPNNVKSINQITINNTPHLLIGNNAQTLNIFKLKI